MDPVTAERGACARLAEELSRGRSLEVKLFAAELAGRIRARAVDATGGTCTLDEVASLLGVCKGRLPQLVAEGVLPRPDEHGVFPRPEIQRIHLWIKPYLASAQVDRLRKLRELHELTK